LLRVEPVTTEVVRDDYGRVVAYLDQLDERARILAREYLESVAKHLADRWPSLSVGMEVRLGEPAAAIDQAVAMTGAALLRPRASGGGIRHGDVGGAAEVHCAVFDEWLQGADGGFSHRLLLGS
jgi:hypothetical protein